MKKPIITVFFFLLTISAQLFAQNIDLYAITWGSPIRFGKVDLQNATLNQTTTINQTQTQITVLYSSAFNQANRRFLFVSKEIPSNQLHFNSIDVVNNSQLPTSTINNKELVYGLQYDLRSAKLYGLRLDSLTSQVYIARINPETGKIISQYPITGVTSFCNDNNCSPPTAFDPQRGIFLFVGKEDPITPRLYRVEASTGQVLSNPPITPYVFELEYDVTRDALYGLRFGVGHPTLFEIDPITAVQQHVKDMSSQANGFIQGSTCFDQQSQTFIFIQHDNGLGRGLLTFYNILQDSLKTVVINNELKELEVDNSSFAAAYFGLSPLSVQPLQAAKISIFPNPAIDKLRIETTQIHERINFVWLSDLTGREVMAKGNINSESYALDVSRLPTGIYLLKLLVGDKIVINRFTKL